MAIPIKEQGQKPHGGTEAAINKPATKGFKNADLSGKIFIFSELFYH